MALKTQGTNLFLIDPDGNVVVAVACVTSIDGLDMTRSQIDTTCLEADAKTSEAGMKEPAAFTFGVNFDPTEDSHVLIEELFQSGVTVNWAIGLSDGATTVVPDVDTDGEFDFPTSRTFIFFDGYVNSSPISIAQNDVIRSTFGVQPSGPRTYSYKQP